MGFSVKFGLVLTFAVLQTVAPVLCCCSGARVAVAAAVRVEPFSHTASEHSPRPKCCQSEPGKPSMESSTSCCSKQATPSAPSNDAPAKPCEHCTKSVPIDPTLPEPVVVPDFSGSVLFVDSVDGWSIATESNAAVLATVADLQPVRLSPLHVRIHSHHAMRC